MILADVHLLAKHLQCDQCSWDWYSIAKRLPDACPNRDCRSREWNGKKIKRKQKRGPAIELPKPPKVRGQADDNFDF